MEETIACTTCGLIQRATELRSGERAMCARCHFELYRRKPNSRRKTLALALAAFILYFPANLLPIVETEYWGMRQRTTIFDGIHGLFETGSYFIGCLVFTTSILSPALKILGLIALCATLPWKGKERFRTWVYRIILIVDPWNMLEVLLLAIMVSIVEMGRVATVHPGPGAFSFTAVVVLTIWASLTFDPRLIWDARKEEP